MLLCELFESATKRTLYHATMTASIPRIQKKGILPLQPSNWVKAGTGERYGEGEIFAFDDIDDARIWAAKMEWALMRKMGSGASSVVTFEDDSDWEEDTAPLVARYGHALKKHGRVQPKNIIKVEKLTPEIIRSAFDRSVG